MRKISAVVSLFALLSSTSISAQETATSEYPSPNAIVDAAPTSDWVKIAPSDLLVMDLAADAEGNARRVVIQLMPEPFSQGWIRNIRKLAAAHWWDGTSINRVQDNYVVQWGDPGYDNPESGETGQKALPEGLETVPESDYVAEDNGKRAVVLDSAASEKDAYSIITSFEGGWQIAYGQGKWPVHCYGAVGVGRNYSPDTGSGAELYTVIGHAPRHLDRNIAVIGRVIEGIEHLSSLPRGKGQLGFYEDASKRVPIRSIRLGDALAEGASPAFEYLDTESSSFAKYADARANRLDPFFIVPAGGADICNIPVPVRRVSGE
ncbi:peptidylprolyl isomerase [Sphingorhabdus sp. M41]|uniref:peptidylprolyl isomerase n=1 Tax=Sphingorhabdus sp. M41 TaxID=1806885 RepID=UPI00078CFAEE|nr:peptidylprolyl isomerase [Sphingorhabdus sp. M41]AMO70519.1 peptidylprolyl isomerase [Sphingorhabdus sp. M41]